MITKDELVKGLVNYIDAEVIPHMTQAGKWILGSLVVLASSKIDEIASTLLCNDMVKALGVVDEKGLIDINSLLSALKISASKYGKLTITIPYGGALTFSAEDIDKLSGYMGG